MKTIKGQTVEESRERRNAWEKYLALRGIRRGVAIRVVRVNGQVWLIREERIELR